MMPLPLVTRYSLPVTCLSAFILAAGEGTRLRPLTEEIPKPLLPVFHKPLLTFAFDKLLAAGVKKIALNTRYLHEVFYREFEVKKESHLHGIGNYQGHPLEIFYEPFHLDTGGGIRNARSALDQGTFLIHNGDILSDVPLEELIASHRASGAMATLVLRKEGGKADVCYDEENNRIEDIWGALTKTGFKNKNSRAYVYAGIAIAEPELFDWIAPNGPVSIITSLLDAMRAGRPVAGFVSRSGLWSDLGTPETYLQTHLRIAREKWKPASLVDKDLPWPTAIHPLAKIDPSAILQGTVVVGPHARVGAGARLTDCILLPGATIAAGAELSSTIVRGSSSISGEHRGGIL